MNTFPLSWLELSADALHHNINQYKRAIGGGTLAPVLKSNAYGHGLVEIARMLETHPAVGMLCVATLSEALKIRAAGVGTPLLIISHIDAPLSEAAGQDIAFTISDIATAQELDAIGNAYQKPFNVHIKIDTGMSRFGVMPQNALAFAYALQAMKYIRIAGIASHFAEAQKSNQIYTHQQLNTFYAVVDALSNAGIHPPFIHTANTSATTMMPLLRCNLFRVGIGAYGLWPSEACKELTQQRFSHFQLRQVMTWFTRIIQIKQIAAGTAIGYDRLHIANSPMHLGLLPVGYADGFAPLTHKGCVYNDGVYAPIIGRVGMNVTAIDLTAMPHAMLDTPIVLTGPYENVDIESIAAYSGQENMRMFPTGINPTLPRMIVENTTRNTIYSRQKGSVCTF